MSNMKDLPSIPNQNGSFAFIKKDFHITVNILAFLSPSPVTISQLLHNIPYFLTFLIAKRNSRMNNSPVYFCRTLRFQKVDREIFFF